MANNRWRLISKLNWGQLIDPLDGSLVGWHARHHRNDKRNRYRLKKRGIHSGIDFSEKPSRTIRAVHGGYVVRKRGDDD